MSFVSFSLCHIFFSLINCSQGISLCIISKQQSKMCSKTSSDYSVLCPKKQKLNNGGGRRRVPRRGPGVAELEKIRLEEQHISPASPLPPPPPPPAEISPTTSDKTGPVYPFSPYFTTGSFPNDMIPPAPDFQWKHDSSLRYLPLMNQLNQGSGGFYQLVEPPSNQTSCLDNEEKIVAKKRPWQFIAETMKCSVGPTIPISRDGKQIKSLDLRLKNHTQDSGTTTRNPITIDSASPATPPIPIIPNPSLDFPRFLQYEQKEESDHEIMSSRRGANLSLNRKPFDSFLPSNEQSILDQDRSFTLRTERYDTLTDHGIDLRLRL